MREPPDPLFRRRSVRRHRWIGIPFAVTVLVGSACGSSGREGGSAASCIFLAKYQGREYTNLGVRIVPVAGRLLGVAVLPGCRDTGQRQTPPSERIPVAELPGVSSDIALVWVTGDGAVDRNELLIRMGIEQLPARVRRLMETPTCEPADEPIELAGPWLGIHDQDRTELDLLPPYQLDMLVDQASSERYERAYLTIEVPKSLGQPLTRGDVAASLWEGGTISTTIKCQGGRFVVRDVKAYPPLSSS
jgi:hypothetical protein